ncbi:MAG: riboflavin synthase [Candidatus Nanopelagicaceae bacterium]|nr:riboflavin synthase [Candidatus Nanopelagicaceae bacterium]
MFTGLIQEMGTVEKLIEHESSIELLFDAGLLTNQIKIGDSISVNGVCLTATENDDGVKVDVMIQTLRLSSLSGLRPGTKINLELAVLPVERLGGHLVQGHVDGVGRVIAREPGERWERLLVSIPKGLMKYVVAQGSIAVDGVSLTVGSIDDVSSQIEIWLIPETLSKTTLGLLKIGDSVNIEVDVLAKYVERLLNTGGSL